MKAKINLGKLNYNGTGKRYPAEVVIELTKRGGEKTFTIDPKTGERVYTGKTTPEYYELSAHGAIWNTTKTDWLSGGQNLDTIAKYTKNPDFLKVYKWWKLYHLNGLRPGTPEQQKAVNEWKAAGNRYDYTEVCAYLKTIGLYEVLFTGKTVGREYKNELYKYGHAHVIEEIPENDLNEIRAFIESHN